MALQFEFVSSIKGTDGLYSCSSCGMTFYGGGKAMHSRDCPDKEEGYAVCTYHFGPEEVEAAKQAAKLLHDEDATSLGPLSVSVLRANMPYLLADWSLDG